MAKSSAHARTHVRTGAHARRLCAHASPWIPSPRASRSFRSRPKRRSRKSQVKIGLCVVLCVCVCVCERETERQRDRKRERERDTERARACVRVGKVVVGGRGCNTSRTSRVNWCTRSSAGEVHINLQGGQCGACAVLQGGCGLLCVAINVHTTRATSPGRGGRTAL